jgi:hypothetical protein
VSFYFGQLFGSYIQKYPENVGCFFHSKSNMYIYLDKN